MHILALDTSTRRGTVAVSSAEHLLLEIVWDAPTGRHTAQLVPMVEWALAQVGWSYVDLDAVAVTVGPGSFTGVRVAMSTAKGIAFAHDLQVAPVSSLEALASNVPVPGRLVVPLLDARKKEIYGAVFRVGAGGLERLADDAVSDPRDFLTEHLGGTEPVTVLGEGAGAYREVIGEVLGERAEIAEGSQAFVRAGNVARLGARALAAGAGVPPSALRTEYLRRPEAEVNAAAAKKS